MTEDLTQALSRLRADVGGSVAPGTGAQVRRRAERRQRHRRAATTLVAAAVVGAVLVGGGLIWRGGPSKTTPVPGGSSSAAPTRTPSAAARPSKPVTARQTPQAPALWTGVNWASATITLPTQQGCPSGPVTVRKQDFKGDAEAIVGPTSWPRVSLWPQQVVYGDVNGDGRAEAVLHATCWQTEEDSGDGQGQLLVVRRDGSTLRAIAWVGPRGAGFTDWWFDGGRLVTDVKPRYVDWGYVLGSALAFRWTGQAFTAVDSGLPGIVSDVDLAPVAGLSGCPAATVRFDAERKGTAAGVTWDATQPTMPDYLPHLVDLDGDGRRHLLAAISCGGPPFVAVLQRQVDGSFRAVDAVRPPDGVRMSDWTYANGVLTLRVAMDQELRYTWNGEYFQR